MVVHQCGKCHQITFSDHQANGRGCHPKFKCAKKDCKGDCQTKRFDLLRERLKGEGAKTVSLKKDESLVSSQATTGGVYEGSNNWPDDYVEEFVGMGAITGSQIELSQ
jgi:hypothetical protein